MSQVLKVHISVLYSCNQCGVKNQPVQVPQREPGDDLIKWMNTMGTYLGNDHKHRSPGCQPETLSDVKIPITGADQVGGAAVQ